MGKIEERNFFLITEECTGRRKKVRRTTDKKEEVRSGRTRQRGTGQEAITSAAWVWGWGRELGVGGLCSFVGRGQKKPNPVGGAAGAGLPVGGFTSLTLLSLRKRPVLDVAGILASLKPFTPR